MLLAATIPTILLLFTERCSGLAAANIALQAALFLVLAHIPSLATGRMSYVDLAWPWGLAGMGLLAAVSSGWGSLRPALASLAFLLQGLRMGLGAVRLAREGHLATELPRYQYQQRRWARQGVSEPTSLSYTLTMQREILVQCVANTGLLVLPLMLQTIPYLAGPLTAPERAGWILWLASYAFEHTADLQKKSFIADCKRKKERGAVCEVGLWRYSRHPNYFGEWMVSAEDRGDWDP